MKKILAAALCAVMIFSVTACGQSGKNETKKEEAVGTESGEETTASEDGSLKEVNVVLDWYPNAIHAFIYDAVSYTHLRAHET